MSVGTKEQPLPSAGEEEDKGGGGGVRTSRGRKEARHDRCLSGLELRIGPGPLKDMDATKLKAGIRKWAKAVVAYARQLSFGSPRSSSSPSGAVSRRRHGAATSSPSKGGHGGDTSSSR